MPQKARTLRCATDLLQIKLSHLFADTDDMDVRETEPRKVIWAGAEVFWEDGGTPNRAPATIEDTSPSGACVRVKRPFNVGARLTIKWHREQFSAIAKNCRSDGRDFLLGLRREANSNFVQPGLPLSAKPTEARPAPSEPPAALTRNVLPVSETRKPNAATRLEIRRRSEVARSPRFARPGFADEVEPGSATQKEPEQPNIRRPSARAESARSPGSSSSLESQGSFQNPGSSSRQERKVMPSKSVFPKFWRRQQDEDAPERAIPKEASVKSSSSKAPAAEAVGAPGSDLLSYDDIYHAAGIMSPSSGYGIHKVVEMLNSQRIRELSSDIKRASVLMALDVAGTSVDDVLQDATRRQQALNAYEAGQRKQLEEFEAHKSRENASIEAEMESVRAHYAQRVQNNRDQIAREKETLRNWQMAMQHESQRISEVIELCRKQPASASAAPPESSSAVGQAAEKASSARA